MPFFNFPHDKSMETLSCYSNQTKEPIFLKNTNFQSLQPKDATDKNFGPIGLGASEEVVFESADVRRQQGTTAFGSGELKCRSIL